MDGCSLFALIACFNWSGLYIDGGLQYQDSGVERVAQASNYRWIPGDQDFALESQSTRSDHISANPYGRIAFGYELRFSNVTLALEATHTSSVATNADRGVNAIGISARWYPFR